jgi:hypothetical protein
MERLGRVEREGVGRERQIRESMLTWLPQI